MATKTSFQCRHAKTSDALQIAEFQAMMALETEEIRLDSLTLEKGVAAVFKDPSMGTYWVVQNSTDEVVASTLVLKEWSDWRNGEVWWIHSVYVLPQFRRQGVFRLIYESLKAHVAANPQLRGLRLYVEKQNSSGISTYRDLGMSDDRYALFEWMKDY